MEGLQGVAVTADYIPVCGCGEIVKAAVVINDNKLSPLLEEARMNNLKLNQKVTFD